MKLSQTCVRDILLFLEGQSTVSLDAFGRLYSMPTMLSELCEGLPSYSQEELFYTLSRLGEGGYLNIVVDYADDAISICAVEGITFAGHEFLEKIRPDSVWEKVTGGVGKIGCYSLQVLEKIAEGVATAYIEKALSL